MKCLGFRLLEEVLTSWYTKLSGVTVKLKPAWTCCHKYMLSRLTTMYRKVPGWKVCEYHQWVCQPCFSRTQVTFYCVVTDNHDRVISGMMIRSKLGGILGNGNHSAMKPQTKTFRISIETLNIDTTCQVQERRHPSELGLGEPWYTCTLLNDTYLCIKHHQVSLKTDSW